MTSYRRTNDASPLEVESSTAGATSRRDHGRRLCPDEFDEWYSDNCRQIIPVEDEIKALMRNAFTAGQFSMMELIGELQNAIKSAQT